MHINPLVRHSLYMPTYLRPFAKALLIPAAIEIIRYIGKQCGINPPPYVPLLIAVAGNATVSGLPGVVIATLYALFRYYRGFSNNLSDQIKPRKEEGEPPVPNKQPPTILVVPPAPQNKEEKISPVPTYVANSQSRDGVAAAAMPLASEGSTQGGLEMYCDQCECMIRFFKKMNAIQKNESDPLLKHANELVKLFPEEPKDFFLAYRNEELNTEYRDGDSYPKEYYTFATNGEIYSSQLMKTIRELSKKHTIDIHILFSDELAFNALCQFSEAISPINEAYKTFGPSIVKGITCLNQWIADKMREQEAAAKARDRDLLLEEQYKQFVSEGSTIEMGLVLNNISRWDSKDPSRPNRQFINQLNREISKIHAKLEENFNSIQTLIRQAEDAGQNIDAIGKRRTHIRRVKSNLFPLSFTKDAFISPLSY